MIDFLLEIGFEEFPVSYLPGGAADLTQRVADLLKRERIFHRSMRTLYSARRMGVLVLGLERKQKSQQVEIQGPPRKVCFDDTGQPTSTLKGFMKAQGIELDQVKFAKTPKGEYVRVEKEVPGRTTEEIFHEAIPEIIKQLQFPKTMVWESSGMRFPRPIRWILALLDRRPLRFRIADVEADRYAWPNYHFSYTPIRLEKPREYLVALRHGGVVADPNERRKLILNRVNQAAKAAAAQAVYDAQMIEDINCTVEYPDAVVGEFDNRFLSLPPEVLQTTLRAHGNVIWLRDTAKFIVVVNTRKKAIDTVARNYAQVMTARLHDALFFHQNDVRTGISAMQASTRTMTWIQGLGTVADKTSRLAAAVRALLLPDTVDRKALERAATLCKADLQSAMVREKEFTSLQGVMGGHYARAAGEPESVAQAIAEHYLPNFVGDALPVTAEGAILSVLDKVDNVLGAFASGHRPTGSQDPFGIRRNGYAVVQILDQKGFDLDIRRVMEGLLKYYPAAADRAALDEFFAERCDRYLQDLGYRYDEIKSVLAAAPMNPSDLHQRCAALKDLRDKPEFAKLVVGQKRVRNILKGQSTNGHPDVERLTEPAEKRLYASGATAAERLGPLCDKKDYGAVLEVLLGMRQDIDEFFDQVMVMCDDAEVRKNRLALVAFINALYLRFADLSQIVIEGEK